MSFKSKGLIDNALNKNVSSTMKIDDRRRTKNAQRT
jgi:hypothetical protein